MCIALRGGVGMWVLTPCSGVVRSQRFEGPYYLYLHS